MSTSQSHTATILVAEDESMVAMLLEDLLTDAGHRVLLAETLAEAMKLAQAEPIGAALLDVSLGREDSFPLADALRARDVPFLFASGYGREGILDRFADVAILQKPYDMKALHAALDRLLAV